MIVKPPEWRCRRPGGPAAPAEPRRVESRLDSGRPFAGRANRRPFMNLRSDAHPRSAFDFGLALDADAALVPSRERIAAAHRVDEATTVRALIAEAKFPPETFVQVQALATRLATAVRAERSQAGGVDALMLEFSLDSREGVALMCVAEALLRIPDSATRDRLIRDKIGGGDWRAHVGASPSLFVNAAAWGLLVTGKLVDTRNEGALEQAFASLLRKGGEPLIRKGVDLAMRLLGRQFVTGRTIDEALGNAREREARGYTYSFDMLGEAALTGADAERYFNAYEAGIHAIGRAAAGRGVFAGPGISLKLSALHPRYSRAQRERVLAELGPRLAALARLGKRYDIGVAIDAEETDRLDLSLDMLALLAADPGLAGWDGLGFVVQTYQKRARPTIDWIVALARQHRRRLMLRLVKGAYWDAEIKRAQVDGMPGYPVFTRKVHTDVAYLACAKAMLAAPDALYPQFASHNAFTIAAVHTLAGAAQYEFQCLHGMGESIYDQVIGPDKMGAACRIYAPVGSHETLLAYLVRRLLENGANSSFVNRIVDPAVSIASLVEDPIVVRGEDRRRAAREPADARRAAAGASQLGGRRSRRRCVLPRSRTSSMRHRRSSMPARCSRRHAESARRRATPRVDIVNPADRGDAVGRVDDGLRSTEVAARDRGGDRRGCAMVAHAGRERAACLERAADLLEAERARFMALAVREAGKTLPNAVGEVREAVDFLRYYASEARAMPDAVRSDRWSRSRRGIFRWRSSSVRRAPRSRRAIPCSQSPPSRRR